MASRYRRVTAPEGFLLTAGPGRPDPRDRLILVPVTSTLAGHFPCIIRAPARRRGPTAAAKEPMNPRLGQLIDEVLQFTWSASPTSATAAGVHDHDHVLADYDAEAIAGRARAFAGYRRQLGSLREEVPALAPDEALDARVLGDALDVEVRVLEELRPAFRDPAAYIDEILYGVYYLVQRDFAPLAERAVSLTGRLRQVPRLLRQAQANLDPASVPEPWVTSAAQQIQGSLSFLAEIEREIVPQAGSAGRDLRAAVREAARGMEEFGRRIRGPIAAGARGRFAIGRDLFEFLLRRQHGVLASADELLEFGRSLIAETQERLAQATRAVDPARSWQALVAEWKADHPRRETFVAEYRAEVERARAFVRDRDLVSLPPGERLHVVETPAFQRNLCPFAAYLAPGPFEEDLEGYFWVTRPPEDAPPRVQEEMLQDHARPGIPATTVHEAYPGHHLQLSTANRIASKVRRFFTTPVLVEGWAFYCEQLMGEEGYYTDPRSRVLQLKDQLWRACRVVVDTSLQTRDMPLQEAVAMLHDVARIEMPNARGEVQRYSRTPTQPLSYAVGKREILGLREEERRRRGAAFRLREFHDRVLSFGSIPIALIREQLLADDAAARKGRMGG
jgi:uncharacterized protein (DUF885 family)